MPVYEFKDPLSMEPTPLQLEDDAAAWSEAVVLCGEMLKDLDGNMPPQSQWLLTVHEGKRPIATIRIEACRHERPAQPARS